ncbi:hypothetical protein [Pseudomonas sp. FR229a]|uniref:hypothetical protein n=1 Tax=Pseudomonas sp. FR229a TaxID=3040313 RepID=UPI0025550D64|nr:hypothetical protein [Pseudomonas sp. FR229a]
MRIWGPDGALQIDENSFTVRVVLSTIVSFGNTKSSLDFSVPGVGPSNGAAIVIPQGDYAANQLQFETELLDGVARVYNHTRGFAASTVAVGSMLLIVMRFN